MNIFGYRSSSVVVSGEGCVFVQVTPVVTGVSQIQNTISNLQERKPNSWSANFLGSKLLE